MALIHCPECQREISTEARACPQCAYPDPGGKSKFNGSESTTLIPCPDCGGRVSKHAKQCPQCGCPLIKNHQVLDEQSPSVFPAPNLTNEVICPHCGLAYGKAKVEKTVIHEEKPQGVSMFKDASGSHEPPFASQTEVPSPVLPFTSKKTMYPKFGEHVSSSEMKSFQGGAGGAERQVGWEEAGFEFSGTKQKFDIRSQETVPLEAIEAVSERWPLKGRERKMNPLWEEMSSDDELPSYSSSPSKWAISLVILVAIVLVFAASVAIWKLVGLEQF